VHQIGQEILSFLNQNGVAYELREHEPVYTSPQMADFLGTGEEHIAKSMIMRKSDGGYFLAVLPGKLKIDFGRLADILGVKSVSLAPVIEAERIAKCSVGSVHPFGNLIQLRTYFDKKLLKNEYLFFNPGSHTESVKINTSDLVAVVKPTIIEFTKPA
jgi:Ala-tRNA(Pro) deacylase